MFLRKRTHIVIQVRLVFRAHSVIRNPRPGRNQHLKSAKRPCLGAAAESGEIAKLYIGQSTAGAAGPC
eukprot:1519946-Alexandrium_andersonii.AAC.1